MQRQKQQFEGFWKDQQRVAEKILRDQLSGGGKQASDIAGRLDFLPEDIVLAAIDAVGVRRLRVGAQAVWCLPPHRRQARA